MRNIRYLLYKHRNTLFNISVVAIICILFTGIYANIYQELIPIILYGSSVMFYFLAMILFFTAYSDKTKRIYKQIEEKKFREALRKRGYRK
jgi:hypothetical protein